MFAQLRRRNRLFCKARVHGSVQRVAAKTCGSLYTMLFGSEVEISVRHLQNVLASSDTMMFGSELEISFLTSSECACQNLEFVHDVVWL